MPDWLVLSVGDGCTIAGAGKGLQDLKELGFIDKVPRLLGVQASGCAPIYHAFCSGSELIPAEENTLADSIAVGVPRNPHKAMCQVRNSLGNMVTVSDDEILAAMRLLGRTCGVFAEPAASAAVAGLARAVNQGLVEKDSQVAVISTGNGLKDIANALKAAGEPVRVAPDIDQLAGIIEEG
jgi:threonine synthase